MAPARIQGEKNIRYPEDRVQQQLATCTDLWPVYLTGKLV